jgi:hypothetical protein
VWIATLLRHKSDFVDLRFHIIHHHGHPSFSYGAKKGWASAMSSGFLCGQPYLQILSFNSCYLGNAAVDDISQALTRGNFKSLKEVHFDNNSISGRGLLAVSILSMKSRLSLEKLWILNNPSLLDTAEHTAFFAENMLMDNPTLKELYIGSCSKESLGYTVIIRALETNNTLMKLHMTGAAVHSRQAVRAQLIESIPKMKGLCYLAFDKELFINDLMRALCQSESLVEVIGR